MLDKLLGNSTEIDLALANEELRGLFIPGETMENAFKLIRDMLVITNLRLILLDRQGISGTKVNITSVPYNSISHFSIQTGGTLDTGSELVIWLRGGTPIVRQFKKGDLIFKVHNSLISHICK